MKRMHLILPMAGHGQRFRDAGYAEEKPLIEVCGKSLLRWSIEPVIPLFDHTAGREARLIFVLRNDAEVGWKTDEACGQEILNASPFFYGVTKSIQLPGSTPGAACTVLAAALTLPPDEPVAVMNCDQWFKCDLVKAVDRAMSERWDGFILTFPGKGPQWSYAVVNGPGGTRVLHVIEKAEVSRHATVGFYWWRRAGDLVKSICGMIAADQRTKGEFYLAPSYNWLPLDSRDVRIVPVEEFVGLGTPEQVKAAEEAATFREV